MPRNRAKESQTVRCIALLIAMARAKRGVQLRRLYDQRGWCWRSAYRDVDTLRAAGVPVQHREQGWFSLDEAWMPRAMLDVAAEEIEALAIARHIAGGVESTPIGRALARLWGKLAAPSGQGTLPFGRGWFASRERSPIDHAAHDVAFATLRDAIGGRRAVHLRYRKPGGTESERVIEPQFVHWEPTTEAFYVIAWCRERRALRTFAVHRIVSATVTREAFEPRRRAAAEVRNAFRLWTRATTQRVAIRFARAIAGEIRERRWHPSQRVLEEPDGAVVLELDIAAPEELERFVLGYGPDAEVLEPMALAQRVQERHVAATAVGRSRAVRAAPREEQSPSRCGSSPPAARRRGAQS